MKLSVGIEYALHCLLYMVDLEEGKSIGIRDLAQFHNISETYLSKAFSKLRKACILSSTTGVKGGYRLARDPKDISFWDVVSAIEGNAPMFRCGEIKEVLAIPATQADTKIYRKHPCVIATVMFDAEEQMRKYLAGKSLAWLYDTVFNHSYTPEQRDKTIAWFRTRSW